MSDEAVASVRENVADSLEDLVWDKYGEISRSDLDENIKREINGIPHIDHNVDYDDLEDSNQKAQYEAKDRRSQSEHRTLGKSGGKRTRSDQKVIVQDSERIMHR